MRLGAFLAHAGRNLEAVQLGDRAFYQSHIRLVLLDQSQRLGAITGFGDDLQFWNLFE